MKVSRDYIGNLIQHRKSQSLYEKTLIGPKRAVFNFFQLSMGVGVDPRNPPPLVRTPLVKRNSFIDPWSEISGFRRLSCVTFVSGSIFSKFVFKCFRKGFVMYFMHKFCQFQFIYTIEFQEVEVFA